MDKPAFLLLLLGLWTVNVSAQPDEAVTDTVTTVHMLSEEEQTDSLYFDAVSERKPVVVRRVPKRLVDSLQAADEFWYANAAPVKKKPKQEPEKGQSIFQQQWFRSLLWFIILSSFVGVVLWYLIASNIFIFRKKAKKIGSEEEVEEGSENIFSLHYDNEISAATTAGNYRLAVRLWYLRTLKELSERGLIDYRYGRTNQDYVAQLSRHPYYKDFFRLTRNFEYTWYGQFDLSAEAYDMMRNDFVHFHNSLQR